MSKVALVSYHFYYNYGTCLQAYALFHYLTKKGFDCEYLNFGQCRCEGGAFSQESFVREIKKKLRAIKYLKYSKIVKSNKRNFDLFRKTYVKETNEYSLEELESIEGKYDFFVLGSDQTLNPDCIGEKFYSKLLLEFVKDGKRKNSYASSLGKARLTDMQWNNLCRLLNSYENISVREVKTAESLSYLLNRSVEYVLDPTFLLGKKEWLSLARQDYCVKYDGYVFCYLLGAKEQIVAFAKKIAIENNLKLLLYTNQQKFYSYGDSLLQDCGPFEFVKTVAYARYVVTDSFHGTILSINCNVNFYAFSKLSGSFADGDNSRIYDFLKMIGLECRLQSDDPVLLEDVDYFKVNERIAELKEQSEKYLTKIFALG